MNNPDTTELEVKRSLMAGEESTGPGHMTVGNPPVVIPPARFPDITADLPQDGNSERGTEKVQTSKTPGPKNNKWGVKWYKDAEEPYQDNLKVPDHNPNESLVQDVSSTAVLTPLDDDLVGNIQVVERGNWSGRFDFLMSLLGYSVGLGNVWRFPYLAYSNGGGAFLFPFILMLILLGVPLMFLELAFGQYAALGPAAIFDRFCPLFHGLGYGMVIVSGMVSLYYTMIIGWCFFYLFASFTAVLPWQSCHPDWRSQTCYPYDDADSCNKINGSIFYNLTCWNATGAAENGITQQLANNATKTPPAEDYFEKYVLDMSGGIEDIGAPRWQLALCLLLAWTLTFLSLSKGVKSTGKVVYFTALFPYVVLTILFFRGITLDGAMDGIIYYVTPSFDRLGDAKVWGDAAVQIFFALSPAWGGLITLSSYNKFHNNCYKDALIVSIGNICTSIFAGLVIFGIIGYLAHELDMKVDEVVKQGAGLAFIVYPDVVTRLPVSPLWSILFFVMMITLGMGSEFALLETVITAVQDTYPQLRKRKTWVVLFVCLTGFIGGLAITTRGGMYILQLMDAYAASWSVFCIAITELVLVAWVYKAERFLQDIEMMIGQQSRIWHRYFALFWKFLSPLTLVGVMIFNWIQYKPLKYGEHYSYPPLANAVGWLMALAPIIFILSMAIYKVCQAPGNMSLLEKMRFLLKPSPEWGPAHKVPSQDPDRNGHSQEKEDKTIENPNFNFNTRV